MSHSGPAIVVERLSKVYGALRAVDDISFAVKSGEVFAFLGPNGAGKSTTAEVIETIRVPTSGTVTVLGMDVTKHKAKVVRRIGVLPQNFSSFDRITVRESLQYYARVFGMPRRHRRADGSHQPARQVRRQVQHALGRPQATTRDRRRARQRPGDPLSRRAHDRTRPPRTAAGLGGAQGTERPRKDGLPHDPLHGRSRTAGGHRRHHRQGPYRCHRLAGEADRGPCRPDATDPEVGRRRRGGR